MNRENYLSVSGADYIRAMFANTETLGSLTLEVEGEEPITWYMDWNEADMEQIATRFEKLLAALKQLGKEHAYWEASTYGMPEELREVWNTYIVPYPDHGMDHEMLFDISMKTEFDEPLTEEEEALWQKEQEWMDEHALTRLPYNRCNPTLLIQRARRYERLVNLHAPKIVLDNEELCLAEEMALYYGLLSD